MKKLFNKTRVTNFEYVIADKSIDNENAMTVIFSNRK
jgi:hypothetical protein